MYIKWWHHQRIYVYTFFIIDNDPLYATVPRSLLQSEMADYNSSNESWFFSLFTRVVCYQQCCLHLRWFLNNMSLQWPKLLTLTIKHNPSKTLFLSIIILVLDNIFVQHHHIRHYTCENEHHFLLKVSLNTLSEIRIGMRWYMRILNHLFESPEARSLYIPIEQYEDPSICRVIRHTW